MTEIAAVVLAAGEASRYGAPKQRLLVPEVLARLAQTSVGQTVVVSGAYSIDTPDARVVHCAEWASGPGASLRCGLAALAPETRAAIVVMADGPDLAPGAVERIIADWRENGGSLIAASYAGVRGHPLLAARDAWSDVPDEGFRARSARLVPCDDLGAPGDVDSPGDLPARLR